MARRSHQQLGSGGLIDSIDALEPKVDLSPIDPNLHGHLKIDSSGQIISTMEAKDFTPFVYPLDPREHLVCGMDEAGRGPLMGDVVAGCVILDYGKIIDGLNDSKKLTEKVRDELALKIKEQALAWGIGYVSAQEIDKINILQASFLAMHRAYQSMKKQASIALIDGNKVPKTPWEVKCYPVVKGDARVMEIAAASILAKTARDHQLYELDKLYPEYGFAQHKGYPTKAHLETIAKLPLLECYRFTYGPIKKLMEERNLQLVYDVNGQRSIVPKS